ncbi:carbohydrate binding domain-containing protein [Paenibacillus athensensis]|uniref:Uncharacterized protein n=1 Tax=Paenibacillus athensensis TaxID=1967502 RepID=A0A4Y8PT53_9BACL|nr:carbohydrate binding domain-containing protein [Paenibacillus athensensis]MCD1261300.1 carbohydrate binding domain-containing protein [Paenibacillus athensensis]
MKKKMNLLTRSVSLVMASLLVVPSVGFAADGGQASQAFSDLPSSHWASAALNHWQQLGIVEGYEDGTIRPEKLISRAEFATVMNRIFGYQAEAASAGNDVAAGAWYRADMAKALEAGYYTADAQGNVMPDAPLSRAAAVVALQAIFGFVGQDGSASTFSDVAQLDAATQSAIAAFSSLGYLEGFEDGTFRPEATLTRAQLMTLAERLVGYLGQDAAETTAGEVDGNVVVNHRDVVLKDTVIDGNLYLTPGIGDGDVKLNHVTVKGKTFIQGGGEHSISVENSELGEVEVNKKDNHVRLFVTGSSSVGKVTLSSGAKLESADVSGDGFREVIIHSNIDHADLSGSFGKISTLQKNENDAPPLISISGTVDELNLNSKTKVTLSDNTVVKTLNADPKAKDSSVEGNGKIEKTNNQAGGLKVKGSDVPVTPGGSGAESSNAPVSGGYSNSMPVLNVTAAPGSEAKTTKLSGSIPEGHHLIVKVSNTKVSTPANGSVAPSGAGVIDPYTIGNDIPNVDVENNKYLAVYQVNPNNRVVKFRQFTLTQAEVNIWQLSFSDEFDGTGSPDSNKWTYDIGTGSGGWGNNELEYYTDRTDNAKQENGELVITARKESYGGMGYTSARLKTMGKHAQKYGKIEVRAKTPEGSGMWPAIWMLPEDNDYGTWASSGEIDIMENKGRLPHEVYGTIHYGEQYPGNTYTGKAYQFPNNGTVADYHVYSLEWEPGEMRWYVDGQLYQTQNDWYSKSLNQPANNTYPAPFDKPFHLILNLALGGNFDGGIVPADSLFPNTMNVDYVRIYDMVGKSYRQPTPPGVVKEPLPSDARLPRPDGNLLYNSSLTEDAPGVANLLNNPNDPNTSVPNTDYWSLFQGEGGVGSVSVDDLNGTKFAKISITNGGSQSYSVQLLNTLSIAKGRFYKLSFDAKSTASRPLTVKVTGGASRGFAAYSQANTVSLTDQVKHYEMMFQMKQDTDIAARTEFNSGLNANTVWIGNARVEEIDHIAVDYDAAKEPLDGDGNRVYNGTFDQGDQTRMNYWHLTTSGGATATGSVSEQDRWLAVNVTNAGDSSLGSVQLLQKGVQLQQGQTYDVTLDASTGADRPIEVELLSKDGAVSYGKQSVTLNSRNFDQFKVSFPAVSATDKEAQFVIRLGGAQASNILLDNIKLIQTSVYIDPSVKLFPLTNGGFDGTIAPWQEVNAGGFATAALSGSEAKVSVTNNGGGDPWGIMFMQDGVALSKGMTYTVEFSARSTVARKMEIDLENASYTRFFDETVSLTNDMQRYKFEFKMTKDDTAALKFFLGKIAGESAITTAHDVYIDDVVVEVKGARQYANMLQSGTFDNGSTGWDSFFNTGEVTGSLATVDGELKASVSGTGGQNWNAQVFHNGLSLVKDKAYQLTFDIRSSVNRDVNVVVEHNGDPYTKYLDKTIGATVTGATYSYLFTMPVNDAGAHLNFMLGLINNPVSVSHDVYFDNVSLVEVNPLPLPPAEGHALLNGDFDTNVDNWSVYKADGSDAQISVVDGKLQVLFPNYDGWEKWSTQVYQNGLKLEAGKTYKLKFDAAANPGKEIKVEILRLDNSALLVTQALNPDSTNHTYTYQFTVNGDTEQNAKLAFLLGGNHLDGADFPDGATITLDSISITEVN